jgi:hypothetical protein
MLDPFLACTAVYVVVAHLYARRARLNHAWIAAGAAVPVAVAVTMVWLFRVHGTETVVQFTAGDDAMYARWSSWLHLWPTVLVSLAGAGIVHVGASLVVLHRSLRRWLPVTLGGALVCALGVAAVFAHAPTA